MLRAPKRVFQLSALSDNPDYLQHRFQTRSPFAYLNLHVVQASRESVGRRASWRGPSQVPNQDRRSCEIGTASPLRFAGAAEDFSMPWWVHSLLECTVAEAAC